MIFNYEFLFPPPEQLEIRRHELNSAGLQAWLTPIALLLALSLGRFALRLLNPDTIDITTLKPAKKPASSSPSSSKLPSAPTAALRKANWILSTTYIPEFGPLYVQLTAAVYTSWLIYLAFRFTGKDYMHLTKQLGHVAVSQLPWQYLLAFKSPRSPVTLATGLTHERLNAFHRLFGRVVHLLLAAHAALYLNFFVRMGVLKKRIGDWDVRLGVAAFWMVNFLGLLSVPMVRRKLYYGLFYRSHVVIAGLVPLILWFHQPWTKWYLGQAAVFYVANWLARSRNSVVASVRSEALAGNDLMKIVIQIPKESEVEEQWTPGQHVYIKARDGLVGPKNPFTILDVKAREKGASEVVLVVRHLGGPGTRRLAALKALADQYVNGILTEDENKELLIEGPYGEASEYLPQLLQEGEDGGQILLVAGGVGASYTLPIYLALLKARSGTEGVRMIWFVKSEADARWGIELLLEQPRYAKSVDIYVTQPSQSDTAKMTDRMKMGGVTLRYTGSRPDLATVIEPIMASKGDRDANGKLVGEGKRDPRKMKKSYEPVTVLVCGPVGLSRSLRKEVGRHVLGYGREVRWYEEQFGFGGS